ncbi:ATP-binding protein [Streptomyces sp. H27-C3]|uniref:ATP-binding protein n=1 Tax=Streptomyces sp. H27-C3 TaxID=3046305 RepID=UPI0024BB8D0D|nr:ATP-binding protein [Streptomyces sp. H27-C3]MDJ0460394.1 ATP-binding protein [Streptomyces sp. H27-C3]
MNAEIASVAAEFVQRFSSTRRGARLARMLALHQLDAWGVPFGTTPSDAAAQIVAELAANAVTHGHVPGRDFELRLVLLRGGRVRIEVADTRGERRPRPRVPQDGVEVDGRGLLLVEALAEAWGVTERNVGKVVWADISVR